MIHTHDTFKAESKRGVPISDPRGHASLAREFLAANCDDVDLLNAHANSGYSDAAFTGRAVAAYNGGQMFLKGYKAEQNDRKAREMFAIGAELGDDRRDCGMRPPCAAKVGAAHAT